MLILLTLIEGDVLNLLQSNWQYSLCHKVCGLEAMVQMHLLL